MRGDARAPAGRAHTTSGGRVLSLAVALSLLIWLPVPEVTAQVPKCRDHAFCRRWIRRRVDCKKTVTRKRVKASMYEARGLKPDSLVSKMCPVKCKSCDDGPVPPPPPPVPPPHTSSGNGKPIPGGNSVCWGGGHTFKRCCAVTPASPKGDPTCFNHKAGTEGSKYTFEVSERFVCDSRHTCEVAYGTTCVVELLPDQEAPPVQR